MVRLRAILLGFLCLWAGGAVAAQKESTLRIEITEGAAPVVGEMIFVTVIGTYHDRLLIEKLDLPRVEGHDWIKLLDDIWTSDNRGVLTMQRRLAIFPKRAGPLTIGPFVHELTVSTPDGRRLPKTLTAEAVRIEVAPFPAAVDWPLAARALEHTDDWSKDPATLLDGETVTRTVTITALGVLPEGLPPPPPMRGRGVITFSPPEERTMEITAAGPVSSATWQWQLRPSTGEPGVLAAHHMPWFDTGRRALDALVLPAAPIGVASFGENRSALSLGGVERPVMLLLCLLAGFVLALSALLWGLETGARARVAAWRARLGLARARRAVGRAARAGDAAALWRAGEGVIAAQGHPPGPAQHAAFTALGRHLFGPDPAPFDGPALARMLRDGGGQRRESRSVMAADKGGEAQTSPASAGSGAL